MQEDSLRGTPLAKYSGIQASDICRCAHIFGNHYISATQTGRTIKSCLYCYCRDFTSGMEDTMSTDTNKSAQKNGMELAQKYARVFQVRDGASYQDKVSLGMYFANLQSLSLEIGASFVQGFVEGLGNSDKASTKFLSLEDKLDLLLEREIANRLSSGDTKTQQENQ